RHSNYSYFQYYRSPQTKSTLFPYTTLFRSSRISNRKAGFEAYLTAALRKPQILRCDRRREQMQSYAFQIGPVCYEAPPVSQERTDRKSTRLNSSHEWNSYAVFCLKKKKEQLPFTGDFAAVALGDDVLSHCFDQLPGEELAPQRGLSPDLKHLQQQAAVRPLSY